MASDFEEQLQNIIGHRHDSEAVCSASLEKMIDSIIDDAEHIEDNANIFEQTLVALLSTYVNIGDETKYHQLLDHLRNYFDKIPKARTAKLVRLIIQSLRKLPKSLELQVSLCKEWIDWSKTEERTLLRQRLETELAEILLEQKRYHETLEIVSRLTSELRKVDHKSQLIEVHLIESRTFRGLGDFSRAKASLTAARTNAAAVYTPPLLQGQLDIESGIIFDDDGDFRTASSYFAEAFDAFAGANDPRALDALKYGLLCRILDGRANECAAYAASAAMILAGKGQGDHPVSKEIDAVLEIAKASEAKSLHSLNKIMEERKEDLESDPIVSSNFKNLVDSLEEQHLLRIVKPYSAIELSRIAEMIHLSVEHVEARLVQMILDQKLKATINQSDGILNIFEVEENNELLTQSVELIDNMDGVVDALYTRCHLMN